MTATHRGRDVALAGLDAPAFADELVLVASDHFRDFYDRLYSPERREYKRHLAALAEGRAADLPPEHPLNLLDEAVYAFVGEAFAAGIEVGAAAAGLHRAINRYSLRPEDLGDGED